MLGKKGFDNDLYVKLQTQKILERISRFGNKLYLEFGGKLFDDLHAARVLPGFDKNVKINILEALKDKTEVLMCISATDIVRNKVRADYGITYSTEALRVIDMLRLRGIYVSGVIITKYEGQTAADMCRQRLELRGEKVYIHRLTKGYPLDVDTIASDEGYGANPFIPTSRPLVVVTAPGPGNGKLGTCLSQLYHENKTGNRAGYAKFETFPIWNLPLSHPVNVAYEAATADLLDFNAVDYYYLNAYGKTAVNYNRDIETFPVLKSIIEKIWGEEIYKSPTDMGVNTVASAITNDEVCAEAAKQEVIRRFFHALVDYKQGAVRAETLDRLKYLMKQLGIQPRVRQTVGASLDYEAACHVPVTAIELTDGRVITGRQSKLLTCSGAAMLNALKVLAGIDDGVKMLPPQVIEPILTLNRMLQSKTEMMNLEQTLVALTVSQMHDEFAALAVKQLPKLTGAEAHSTHILMQSESQTFRRLGIELTTESRFITDDLFFD